MAEPTADMLSKAADGLPQGNTPPPEHAAAIDRITKSVRTCSRQVLSDPFPVVALGLGLDNDPIERSSLVLAGPNMRREAVPPQQPFETGGIGLFIRPPTAK